jgi:ubiquinone/menaquinone biosynthesis C-methylase UbiE
MLAEEFDLAHVDSINRAHSDRYALEVPDIDPLKVPYDDLDLFQGFISGERMLDIGCGWSRYVSEFINRGFEYHGTDVAPRMIDLSRRKFPGLDFKVMSYRALEFPDESFDGLWSCCVISHEPKRNIGAILKEWQRVLVVGGVLSIITPYFEYGDEEIIHDDGLDFFYAAWEHAKLRDALEASGFKIIRSDIRWQDGAMSFHVRK